MIVSCVLYFAFVLLIYGAVSLLTGPFSIYSICTFFGVIIYSVALIPSMPKDNNIDALNTIDDDPKMGNHGRGPMDGVYGYIFALGTIQLRRFLNYRIHSKQLSIDNKREVDSFYNSIQQLGTSPRFHPRSDFTISDEILDALIGVKAVWVKIKNESLHIGLNRKYDRLEVNASN